LTASTLDFGARLGLTRTAARAKGQPPDHAVPFTLLAVVTAYALLFLPLGIRLDYTVVAAAAALSVVLLGMTLLWPTFPRVATLAIPLGYIVLAALLREAAGGATSGFGGLFLLPVLWLALTAKRRELAAILAAMGATEIWRYDGQRLRVILLGNDRKFHASPISRSFPFLPLEDVVRFLNQRATQSNTAILRSFRSWAREQIAHVWPAERVAHPQI